jgi:uncharacterized LabA/DUF88 family protein
MNEAITVSNAHTVVSRKPRIGIFLEENLFIGARKSGRYVDVHAIKAMARSIGEVVHASAHLSYDAGQTSGSAMKPLWMALRRAGFTVLTAPRATTGNGRQKSRVDVDMAYAIGRVTFTKGLDMVVLGTGDGDFTNLVRDLEAAAVTTVILSPGKNQTSPDLLLASTTFFDVEELADVAAAA